MCGWLLPLLAFVSAGGESADVQLRAGTSATISATVSFAPRPTLNVSTDVLEFVVPAGSSEATAALTFSAAMRVQPHAEVLLLLQPTRADHLVQDESAEILTFIGEGTGVLSGALSRNDHAVAAQWRGGGRREGRLVFTLRAAPGLYRIPIRLALTVP